MVASLSLVEDFKAAIVEKGSAMAGAYPININNKQAHIVGPPSRLPCSLLVVANNLLPLPLPLPLLTRAVSFAFG
jgi:hypothetical protein